MERMESNQQDKTIFFTTGKRNTNTIIVSFFAKAKVHQQKQSQS
jgi:hypothetical protein